MIRILKASAGSGKTYSLTKQYISLLLGSRNKFAYRHILAVTFTTAATAEMKGRILKELDKLATDPETSPYKDDFVPSVVKDVPTLQSTAREILCNILHDYGSFSVTTIDSFFQQTLRAFSREIGQFASYQIELDEKALQEEVVDDLLDSLTEDDAQTLGWITDSAMEQVEEIGYYSMDKGLKELAGSMKSEQHRAKIEQSGLDEDRIYSMENLNAIRRACNVCSAAFEDGLRDTARQILNCMMSEGLSEEDFSSGKNFVGVFRTYAAWPKGKLLQKKPTDPFLAKCRDTSKWFRKKEADTFLPRTAAMAGLTEKFADIVEKDFSLYKTVRMIKSQLYNLGLTGALYRSYNRLLKEKNILCICDTNLILKDIIAGSDAPFVYEKTGVRYENFLLDEFQDTSAIQWENFEPLLKESEANGHENFIVGDVKQSIYRWRGSDWNLLAQDLEKEMPNTSPETLTTNYRSLANVVNFNNELFSRVSVALDAKLRNSHFIGDEPFIGKIYEDVSQICAADGREGEQKGCVSVTFCDKECEMQKVLDAVGEVLKSGGNMGDIAVLTRKNDDGAAVAKFLIGKGMNVMTADSLKVKSSLTVNRLVSLMSTIDNSGDKVGAYLASSLGIDTSCEYQSLVELCEALIRELKDYDERQGEGLFSKEVAFVDAFVDAVAAYANLYGNSLHGFLSYWKEKDLKIACPEGHNAIRVLSVHASKGLEFPYVIFPYAEKLPLFRSDKCWCVPEKADGLDEVVSECVYDMPLSSSSVGTMFGKDYEEELRKQYVDNANLLYVALTRASRGLYIIAATPSDGLLKYTGGPWDDFSRLHEALYMFAVSGYAGLRLIDDADEPTAAGTDAQGFCKTFRVGAMPRFDHQDKSETVRTELGYPSYPVDLASSSVSGEGRSRRLVLSREYSDFFSSGEGQVAGTDGEAGGTHSPERRTGVSARMRGIVLHDILSAVRRPEDLEAAVSAAVTRGEIGAEDEAGVRALLEDRIGSAVKRGWFSPDSAVRNEVDMIDTDGEVYRPDRVEIRPDGSVLIIDYKFGSRRQAYLSQIARYADLWKRMGHENVSTFLWYVFDDVVVS